MASIASRDLYAGLGLLRLRVFVAVVEQGGHTAAAAHLDMAQPTVSFHVKALEALLGARRLAVQAMTVTLGDLGPLQQDLFASGDTRGRRLQQALDTVTRRYGPGTIQPGSLLGLATYPTTAAV